MLFGLNCLQVICFTCAGPVYQQNFQPVGVVLVGRSLPSLGIEMRRSLTADVTFV